MQLPKPVLFQSLAFSAFEHLALLMHEVRVGGTEARQRGRSADRLRRVESPQLVEHQPDRPFVGGDVMHREQEHVLRLGSREERGPENWPALEIERLPVVSLDLRLKPILCRTRRIDDVQRDLAALSCDLDGSHRPVIVDRAQQGMAIDQRLNRVTQCLQ